MTRISQRVSVGVAVLSMGLVLAACGGDSESDKKGSDGVVSGDLRTFTYADTVDASKVKLFKKAYPDVKLRSATFQGNDEAAAKIKAGFRTDVIEVCLDEQGPLVDAGALAPIDTSRLEHWDDLDPTFRDAAGVSTGGEVTMVPEQAGAIGLIYDKDEFPNGVDSWTALYDPANSGRVALDGTYWLTPIAQKALANGNQDPMGMDDGQVEDVKDQLIELREDKHFRAFTSSSSDIANLFKSGEVVLADGGRPTADEINDGGGNVGWAAPKEGALSWVCGLSVSSNAKNIDAAYAFINDATSPETQALFGSSGWAIINPKGVPLVDKEFAESADPRGLEGAHAEVAPKNADTWRKTWQEVRAG